MSNIRSALPTVRKRWARWRSKSLAPNTEQKLYRARTPPPVVDPRVKSRRRLPH